LKKRVCAIEGGERKVSDSPEGRGKRGRGEGFLLLRRGLFLFGGRRGEREGKKGH